MFGNKGMSTIKEIMTRCEMCQNIDGGHKWHGQRIIGTFIKYRCIDENNTIMFERCNIHFSSEECEQNPEWKEVV